MRELCAPAAGRGRSGGVADIPLPVGMQAHLIAVIDIVAKLHEIFSAQDCLASPKNRGCLVLLEAMLADEPATHALLFDVVAALGDERGKDTRRPTGGRGNPGRSPIRSIPAVAPEGAKPAIGKPPPVVTIRP